MGDLGGFVFPDQFIENLVAVRTRSNGAAKRAPKQLSEHDRGCAACPLQETWNQISSPQMKLSGAADADILVLGEGPGEEEDRRGKPFVGPAGMLLHKVLPHKQRDRLAMTNAVRCRPPANRTPTWREIHACSVHLDDDLASGRFTAILGLGGVPLSRFLNEASITQIHGLKFPVRVGDQVLWYFPTLHPSFVLRTGADRSPMLPILRNDLNYFFKFVDTWAKPVIEKIAAADVICAHSEEEARGWCSKLRNAGKPIGFDLETNGLRPNAVGAEIMTVAVSDGTTTVAWPVRHPQAPNEWGLPLLLEMTQHMRWIAHHAGFELAWLREHARRHDLAWEPEKGFDDSMVAARLFQRREGCLNLGVLTRIYCGVNIKKLSDINTDKIDQTPLNEVLPYNGLDAWGSWRIFQQIGKRVDQVNYHSVLNTIESVTEMQLTGLDIDPATADELHQEWNGRAQTAATHAKTVYEVKQFERERQQEFNIGSPDDVADALISFGRINLPKTTGSEKEGATKQRYSTDDNVLNKLAADNPLARDVLEYRHATKMVSTYVEPVLAAQKRFVDGKLHPVYSTVLTKTLRTSCEDPNCFPGYVEVLTNTGWRRWDQVDQAALLAQWDAGSQQISFARPLELGSYEFDGDLIRITTDLHLDIICTPNHRFLTRNRAHGNIEFKQQVTAETFPKWYDIPLAGFYEGGATTLRESQLIIAAAFQADAYWPDKEGYIDWTLTRRRKIERLHTALLAENIEFTERSKGDDKTTFYVPRRAIPRWLPNKRHFGPWILSLTAACLTFLSEEIWHWDGGINRNDFCTGNENDADWVQIILTLTGRAATIRRRASTSEGSIFVTARDIAHATTSHHTKERTPYQGTVYCATMPRGTLIVRHGGRSLITGNCQNFPKRKDKELRRSVVPPKGCVWASADYGQLEARIYAMASQDRALCASIIDNEDIHSHWLNVILRAYPPYIEHLATKVTPNQTEAQIRRGGRDIIKGDFVFASFFGTTARNVSERTGIPLAIATEVLEAFWKRYAGAYDWLKTQRRQYFETGLTKNLCGVERYGIMLGNEPLNTPIQSTAARLVLESQNEMYRLYKRENDPHLLPRINIHDDLTFALPDDDALLLTYIEEISKVLVRIRFDFQIVPLKVEWKIGTNWAELHDVYEHTGEYVH